MANDDEQQSSASSKDIPDEMLRQFMKDLFRACLEGVDMACDRGGEDAARKFYRALLADYLSKSGEEKSKTGGTGIEYSNESCSQCRAEYAGPGPYAGDYTRFYYCMNVQPCNPYGLTQEEAEAKGYKTE